MKRENIPTDCVFICAGAAAHEWQPLGTSITITTRDSAEVNPPHVGLQGNTYYPVKCRWCGLHSRTWEAP